MVMGVKQFDPVGGEEIAERLEVAPSTVRVWRHRGLLPEPEGTVSGRECWNWPTIRRWAEKTGRLPDQGAPST